MACENYGNQEFGENYGKFLTWGGGYFSSNLALNARLIVFEFLTLGVFYYIRLRLEITKNCDKFSRVQGGDREDVSPT